MQYAKSTVLLFFILAACTGTREPSDWVSTDHPDATARSRLTETGIVSELRSNATGALVSTMIVTPDGASWRDAHGEIHNIAVGSPAVSPSTDGAPQFSTVQQLPGDERIANDWLYMLSLPEGVGSKAEHSKPACFDVGSCTFCCTANLCCYACDNGSTGCGTTTPV